MDSQAVIGRTKKLELALGRGIPVISIRLGEDPCGFIGTAQAISGQGSAAEWAKGLIETLSGNPRLAASLLAGLVRQWESVTGFKEAIDAMNRLDACKGMPPELLDRVERAYQANGQLHRSGGVNRKYPAFIKRMKDSRDE